jgi:signal transduction histidine kinase
VIRHSRANQCVIRLTRSPAEVAVEIEDDGIGAALTEATGATSNGLRGLSQRIAAIGGRYEAGPRAGGGFHLAVYAPVSAAERLTLPSATGGALEETRS